MPLARPQRQRGFHVCQGAKAPRVADAVLLPFHPSGRWDVEPVADTAARSSDRRRLACDCCADARAPRHQSTDQVTVPLAGQGVVEQRSPPSQPLYQHSLDARFSPVVTESTEFRFATICPRTPLAGPHTVHMGPARPRSTGSQRPILSSGSAALGQIRPTLQPAYVARQASLEPG